MQHRLSKHLVVASVVAWGLVGCWSTVQYESKSTAPEACLVAAVGSSATVSRRGDLLRIETPEDKTATLRVTDEGKFSVVEDPANASDLTFKTQVLSWLALANENCARKWERMTVQRVDPMSLPKSEVGEPSHIGHNHDGGSCDVLKRCLHTLAETTCRDNPDCGFDIRANPFEESVCKTILDAMKRRSQEKKESLPQECF